MARGEPEPPSGAWNPAALASAEALRQRLTLVRRLCGPLAYLHGEGLVHRDLKPDNILLTADSRSPAACPWPVLADFGLAASVPGATGREALELEGIGAGTVLYMAPEQIRGEALDARADLYALGCVLYELLAGQPPFVGSNEQAVLRGHLYDEPRPPSELAGPLPEGLDELVLRLLAKGPRQRLGHAEDVGRALEALGAGAEPWPGAPRAQPYLYRPALAGREAPLAELEAALGRLEAGEGGMLFLAGESGVGKTRLLLELSRRAQRRQVQVLAGECVPGGIFSGTESARAPRGRSDRSPLSAGGGGPLEALRRPLQSVAARCRERGAAETERLLGRRGKVLAAYVPELSGLPGQEAHPEPAELPADAARLRLFIFLAETFEALAGGGEGPAATRARQASPLLLMLDDLQWADDLTLGFLEHWLRARAARAQHVGLQPVEEAQPAAPLLIVGTYRSEEAGPGQATPLQRLLEASGVARLDLGRLDEPAVASIVGDMLALSPAPALFAQHLGRHSEGNPFFVAEYLRAAVAEGLLYRDAQGRWQVAEPGDERATAATYEALPLPTTLRELVGRRLQGLGRRARRLAEAAAVLGREAELAVLEPMLGIGQAASPAEDALLDMLTDLLRRQVLEVPAPGRLRFVHDKIREVAYADLRKDLRKKLHRAAAESIESVHAAGLAPHQAVLGGHWEQAGQPDKARTCYLAAARQAVRSFDHAEAERLGLACMRLADRSSKDSVQVRTLLARMHHERGSVPEALAQAKLAVEQAQELGDRVLEAHARHQLAVSLLRLGRLEEARQHFEQVLGASRELGLRNLEGYALTSLGNTLNDMGRLKESQTAHEQALEVFQDLSNRVGEGAVLHNLSLTYQGKYKPESAQQLLEQALQVRHEVGDRLGKLHTIQTLANHLGQQGRWKESRELFEQALELARTLPVPVSEGAILSDLASALYVRGRLEEARPFAERALVILRELGRRRFEALALELLAGISHELGQQEPAESFMEGALRIARSVGDPRLLAAFLTYRATMSRRQGKEPDSVEPLLDEGQDLLSSAPDLGQQFSLFSERGHLALARRSSAMAWLLGARAVYEQEGLSHHFQASQEMDRLGRAVEAFEAGEQHRLFRGELVEDMPEGLRRWLRETGQLPPAQP